MTYEEIKTLQKFMENTNNSLSVLNNRMNGFNKNTLETCQILLKRIKKLEKEIEKKGTKRKKHIG